MRVDTFQNFTLLPSTPYEAYQRLLRATPKVIVQEIVPQLLELRDIEIGTDALEYEDKEVQFAYGDDTALLNIMKCIKDRRDKPSGKSGKNQALTLLEQAEVVAKGRNRPIATLNQSTRAEGEEGKAEDAQATGTTASTLFEEEEGASAINSLSQFLQRTSQVMESLLVESELQGLKASANAKTSSSAFRNRNSSNSDFPSAFDDASTWVTLGKEGTSGQLEYVRNRAISFLRFSTLQPHILITGHPTPDTNLDEDLKPNSVSSSV
jgi:hypothetical protein